MSEIRKEMAAAYVVMCLISTGHSGSPDQDMDRVRRSLMHWFRGVTSGLFSDAERAVAADWLEDDTNAAIEWKFLDAYGLAEEAS